jgi:MFS transporter, SP family, arabinose:H+ symporter
MIYFIAGIAALSGLLFGFDEGVIAGILPILTEHFHLTDASQGFLASALPLGAMFASIVLGSYIATKLTNKIGRRQAILFAAILFTISSLGAALAVNLWLLIFARLLVGLAIGVAGVMTPLYIAEMVPAKIRGRLVSCYQLAITIGILSGYLLNYTFIYGVNWRWMFAAGAIPSLILLIGMYILPESHRWLMLTGQKEKAREVLRKLHATNIDKKLDVISHTISDEGDTVKWSQLLSPTVRPALIVAMMLFVLQQVSGINVVIYYAPSIFGSAGFSTAQTQIMATVGVGLVNVLSTVLAMWLIEKLGRRILLYIGFAGAALTLFVISFSSQLEAAGLSYVTLIATFAYIFSFAIAIGPIPHIMMSEVFPMNVRNTGMGVASICNWGFNFLVVFTYPIFINVIGMEGTFWIYGVACILGLFFTYFYVPETKGIALEEITEHLLHKRPLRDLGSETYTDKF